MALYFFIMDAIGLMGLANSSSGQHGSFIFPVYLGGNYSCGDQVWIECARFNTGVTIAGCAMVIQSMNNGSFIEYPNSYIELTNQETVNTRLVQCITTHTNATWTAEIAEGTEDERFRFTYEGTDIIMEGYATSDGKTSARLECSLLFIIAY